MGDDSSAGGRKKRYADLLEGEGKQAGGETVLEDRGGD